MSNSISIVPVLGSQGGSENSCIACGARYLITHFVEATDHAIDKKYLFGIVTCDCGRLLNKTELRKTLPEIVYDAVFFNWEWILEKRIKGKDCI